MWILLALLVRLLWAGTNAIDQLLARAHPQHNVIAAMTVQYICYLPFVALGLVLGPAFHIAHTAPILLCVCAAMASALALIPYLEALRREQAYNVTPYLELTPVCLITLVYFLKHETLMPHQLLGATFIIVSGFVFSWDFLHARFKGNIFILLATASFLWAIYQYCISQSEPEIGICNSAILVYVTMSLIGIGLFIVRKDVRDTVITTFIATRGKPAILALSTNLLEVIGFVLLLIAFREAPTIGHVSALGGVQPMFSFLLTLPLAKFYPNHFAMPVFDRELYCKLTLLIVILAGMYLLAT